MGCTVGMLVPGRKIVYWVKELFLREVSDDADLTGSWPISLAPRVTMTDLLLFCTEHEVITSAPLVQNIVSKGCVIHVPTVLVARVKFEAPTKLGR